jgi:ATP-dependent exoDNAse (exonuclease V) alpha subunit
MILGYALSIHKLQGSTCDRVILNPGPKEFAAGLLLVGATRTKTFQGLAFHPMPNYIRFEQVNKMQETQRRIAEEARMEAIEQGTIQRFIGAIQECCQEFDRSLTE